MLLRLAVEAVIGEPVSGSVFPVWRENTGKFCRLRPVRAMQPRIREQIQSVSSKFPKNRNREFRRLNRELPIA
jgi:hypothetical protein